MDQQEFELRQKLQYRGYKHQRELQKQKDRSEIANQRVRGGMIMNGGGAIALLAFIQASLESDRFPELGQWAAWAILVFVAGLSATGAANYLRIKVSLADDKADSSRKRARVSTSRSLQLGSTLLFMVGCIVFAIGIFKQFG